MLALQCFDACSDKGFCNYWIYSADISRYNYLRSELQVDFELCVLWLAVTSSAYFIVADKTILNST